MLHVMLHVAAGDERHDPSHLPRRWLIKTQHVDR